MENYGDLKVSTLILGQLSGFTKNIDRISIAYRSDFVRLSIGFRSDMDSLSVVYQ